MEVEKGFTKSLSSLCVLSVPAVNTLHPWLRLCRAGYFVTFAANEILSYLDCKLYFPALLAFNLLPPAVISIEVPLTRPVYCVLPAVKLI